jgi:hypothetical protein
MLAAAVVGRHLLGMALERVTEGMVQHLLFPVRLSLMLVVVVEVRGRAILTRILAALEEVEPVAPQHLRVLAWRGQQIPEAAVVVGAAQLALAQEPLAALAS